MYKCVYVYKIKIYSFVRNVKNIFVTEFVNTADDNVYVRLG